MNFVRGSGSSGFLFDRELDLPSFAASIWRNQTLEQKMISRV